MAKPGDPADPPAPAPAPAPAPVPAPVPAPAPEAGLTKRDLEKFKGDIINTINERLAHGNPKPDPAPGPKPGDPAPGPTPPGPTPGKRKVSRLFPYPHDEDEA